MDQPIEKPKKYREIIREILVSADGPVAVDELIDQMLSRRPSNAKNPRAAALTKIREEQGDQIVFLDSKHVLPVRLAFQGARYRIRLKRENINRAALSFNECFRNYLPLGFDPAKIGLINRQGHPIPFQLQKMPLQKMPQDTPFFLELAMGDTGTVFVMKEWFHSQNLYRNDHILVTIKDWENGIFLIEREKSSKSSPDLLAARNRYVADEIYKFLEQARGEKIYVHYVLPAIYAKMPDKDACPPDHWMFIVNEDARMAADAFMIYYSDSGFTPLRRILANISSQSLAPKPQKYSGESARNVYRFRAQLLHTPGIWREIEIQGKQTMAELDSALRTAFRHDPFDHLSGFWKKVARVGGSGKRFREVEIATVSPYEYTEGSDTAVAALDLRVGDQIKYVYDMGDWFEHTLELQSIGSVENSVQYPREIARNKPSYAYCDDCQKNGKRTVAKWICYTCSSEEGHDVLVCEDCLGQHEDHYIDEIIY